MPEEQVAEPIVTPEAAPDARGAPLTSRMATLDAARFVAAIAIVWLHSPESELLKRFSALSGFAVPFFTMSAVLLVFQGARRDPTRPLGTYALSRVRRIYVPFLVWTVIYLLIRNLKHAILSHEPIVRPNPSMLLAGSAHHLWFLPFILVLTIVAFAAAKLVARSTSPAIAWTLAIVLLLAGVLCGRTGPQWFADWYLLNRTWAASPAIAWGFALAIVYPLLPDALWQNRALSFFGVAIWVGCAALSVPFGSRFLLPENLAGLGFFILSLARWTDLQPLVVRLAGLGSLAYGVYLSHIMFVEGVQAIAARAGIRQVAWLDVVVFLLSATLAIGFVRAVSGTKLGRWLLPA